MKSIENIKEKQREKGKVNLFFMVLFLTIGNVLEGIQILFFKKYAMKWDYGCMVSLRSSLYCFEIFYKKIRLGNNNITI